jgi:hypothetical protein
MELFSGAARAGIENCEPIPVAKKQKGERMSMRARLAIQIGRIRTSSTAC